jgi:hypothetical protein
MTYAVKVSHLPGHLGLLRMTGVKNTETVHACVASIRIVRGAQVWYTVDYFNGGDLRTVEVFPEDLEAAL